MKPRNMAPMIYEKVSEGIMTYDVYSRLAKERILFLKEPIDGDISSDLVASLFWLDSLNSTQDITIYINSPGGTVCDGLFTIYDTLQFVKSPIKTVCIGEAYSGAAVILAAGTKGKRLAYPNARIMIHSVQTSGMSGAQHEIQKEAEMTRELNESLMEILARHAGQPLSKVRKDCMEDKYMTAKQALQYGIIDEIVKPYKENPPLVETKSKKKKSLP